MDFVIYLLSDTYPISIAPYKMGPGELKELMLQFNNLLDKGFIKPNISPWGDQVVFFMKKDRSVKMYIY